MIEADKKEFAKITTGVLANFGTVATKPLLSLWFQAAKHDNIAIEQWAGAATQIIKNRKYTSQPTYADFCESIQGKPASLNDIALAQVAAVIGQVRSIGSWGAPVFDDPVTAALMSSRWTWPAVCAMTEAELKWWSKEFADAYLAYDRVRLSERKQIGNNQLKCLIGGIGKRI